MKKSIKIILMVISFLFGIIAILFFIRLINSTEIDDITPGIACPELQEYSPDILYVIPNYSANPISENPEWCSYILSLNKSLGLHGVYHEYKEFKTDRNQTYLEEGVDEFKSCFGYKPEIFKPPQLRISAENKQLVRQNNLKLKRFFSQITHKVYHCSDSDIISNRIIHIF